MPGMLLISPQAVMFEPTDSQSAPPPPAAPPAASADDDTSTSTTAADEAAQRDWIIVPMDSICSIMISHHCAAVSTRYVSVWAQLLTYLLRFAYRMIRIGCHVVVLFILFIVSLHSPYCYGSLSIACAATRVSAYIVKLIWPNESICTFYACTSVGRELKRSKVY